MTDKQMNDFDSVCECGCGEVIDRNRVSLHGTKYVDAKHRRRAAQRRYMDRIREQLAKLQDLTPTP
jgi:hypothetical protein